MHFALFPHALVDVSIAIDIVPVPLEVASTHYTGVDFSCLFQFVNTVAVLNVFSPYPVTYVTVGIEVLTLTIIKAIYEVADVVVSVSKPVMSGFAL